jgi:hypothetical protein
VAQDARERAYRARHNWTGDLYAHGRDLADVAKLLRADMRAAGIVGRVTISRYSQGQSLTVAVAAPAGMVLLSTRRIRQDLGLVAVAPGAAPDMWRSREAAAMLATVEAMANRYCRSWSDKNQTFGVHADFAGTTVADQRDAIVAAITGASK